MKKILGLGLAIVLGIGLVGCSKTEETQEPKEEKIIEVFSEALNERWKNGDKLDEKYEKETNFTDTEYINEVIKNIQEEIKLIEEELINVKDKELKELVETYIEGDKLQVKSFEVEDYELSDRYFIESEQLRKPSLIRLVEEYGVKIDEENIKIYEEFKEETIIINKQKDAEEFLNKLAIEAVIEKSQDEFGDTIFTVIVENASEIDFSTVQYQVNFKDAEGVVVGNDWIYLENFDIGTKQKVVLNTYGIEGIEKVVLTTDYFEVK